MFPLASTVTLLLAPPIAAAIPFVLRTPGVARYIPKIHRLPVAPGFTGSSNCRSREGWRNHPRTRVLFESMLLAGCVLIAMNSQTTAFMTESVRYELLRSAAFDGFITGFVLLLLIAMGRSLYRVRESANNLDTTGVSGVWEVPHYESESRALWRRTKDRAEQVLTQLGLPGKNKDHMLAPDGFVSELLRQVASKRRLDVLAGDGLDVLSMLAVDGDPARGPMPVLRGTSIRMLLLPTRSSTIDPQRKRMSCAEVALARLERSVEDHERRLRHSLQLQHVWEQQHGINFQVRFLESRPAFAYLQSGDRVWAQVFGPEDHLWLEFEDSGSRANFGSGLTDLYASEWSRGRNVTTRVANSTETRQAPESRLATESSLAPQASLAPSVPETAAPMESVAPVTTGQSLSAVAPEPALRTPSPLNPFAEPAVETPPSSTVEAEAQSLFSQPSQEVPRAPETPMTAPALTPSVPAAQTTQTSQAPMQQAIPTAPIASPAPTTSTGYPHTDTNSERSEDAESFEALFGNPQSLAQPSAPSQPTPMPAPAAPAAPSSGFEQPEWLTQQKASHSLAASSATPEQNVHAQPIQQQAAFATPPAQPVEQPLLTEQERLENPQTWANELAGNNGSTPFQSPPSQTPASPIPTEPPLAPSGQTESRYLRKTGPRSVAQRAQRPVR